MKNIYLLITSEDGYSQYTIEAENWQKALVKCYKHYGENHCITITDFETIIQGKKYEDAINVFELLIGEDVIFLGIVQQIFSNYLDKIDEGE